MSMPSEQPDTTRISDPIPVYPTVFERLAPVAPRYAYGFWTIAFIVAVAATLIVASSLETTPAEFRALCIFQAAGLIAVPLGIQTGYRILRHWAPHIDTFMSSDKISVPNWFAREFAFIRGSWEMGASGVGLGALTVIAYYMGDYFAYYPKGATLFASTIIFVSAGFAGAGLYAMFLTSRAFWRLGKLSDTEIRVHRHPFGVLSTGNTLFKCWFVLGLLWAMYVASAVFGKSGFDLSQLSQTQPMWLLAYPTFPLIVGTFLICQIPMHQKMVGFKRAKLARIERILDSIRPMTLSDLNNDVRDNIEFLERQKQTCRRLPEWPFNLRALFGSGITSVTALFPIIAAEVVKKWIV